MTPLLGVETEMFTQFYQELVHLSCRPQGLSKTFILPVITAQFGALS